MECMVYFFVIPVLSVFVAQATFIKSVKHSSTYNNKVARFSIDGDDSTYSMTGFQFDSWWTGTLDSECPLRAVEIHGEHPPMLILAGKSENNKGSRRPTLQNPRCKLVNTATVLGQPDWETYDCDVIRNTTTIDIVPARKVDHSLIFFEVKAHCL